jgi:subtilisin family serine protease
VLRQELNVIKKICAFLLTATVLLVGASQTKYDFLPGDENVFTPEQKPEYVPDRIFVVYKKQGNISAQQIVKASIETKFGLEELYRFEFIDVFLYRTHWERDKTLAELNNNPYVEYAEPDKIIRPAKSPNDIRFDSQWALHNTGQNGGVPDADIDAPEAWDITTGNETVIIAVIDSGVDYNHEDLKANMWTNQGEIPGNGLDDDGNGYIDDYFGWNAVDGNGDPMDDMNDAHGTHVAGIIGAVGNNGIGISGVCWNCRIMALKFMSESGTLSDEIKCIEYAIKNGAHIINGSYGDYEFARTERAALMRARDAGILCAFAAGNKGYDNDDHHHYPSSYDLDNIIAVAYSTRKDELNEWSNYGPASVDIAAPGTHILSTMPSNSYQSMGGTSMAAPHVAGLAALIKSHDFSLTYTEIKDRILSNGDPIASMTGKLLTGARINAYRAIDVQKVYSLTIQAGSGGTTSPLPGKYVYTNITNVLVTAVPDTHFRFLPWTGNVPKDSVTNNPVTLSIDSEKILQANFQRIIYPPTGATGQKVLNRSLSQREYINVITWQANPDNEDITRYRIYLINAGGEELVKELNAHTFEYWDRNVEKETLYRYKLVALNSNLREGDPVYLDIQ